MNTLEAIKIGAKLLKEKKISSYILDSELLLSKALNKTREEILINLDKIVKENKISIIKHHLEIKKMYKKLLKKKKFRNSTNLI